MITKEEYLKAVDICTLYEMQQKKKVVSEKERMEKVNELVNELIAEYDLANETRKQVTRMRRQALMWWLSKNTGYEYHYIGGLFGKGHSTVTNSVKRVNELFDIGDGYFHYTVSPILEKLIHYRRRMEFFRRRGRYSIKTKKK